MRLVTKTTDSVCAVDGSSLRCGEKAEVYVSHWTSPSRFWCQLVRDEARLERFTEQLQLAAAGDVMSALQPGQLCAAR